MSSNPKLGFKHVCFISYRHNDIAKSLAEWLRVELQKEFSVILSSRPNAKTPWQDIEQIKTGNEIDDALAQGLCRSVCMISLYQPDYFSSDKPDCTREFVAMKRLEAKRLGALKNPLLKHRLIIPIKLRDPKGVPKDISDRSPYDSTQLAGDDRSPQWSRPHLQEIAEYIVACCDLFAEKKIKAKDCDKFALPNADDKDVKHLQTEAEEFQIRFPR